MTIPADIPPLRFIMGLSNEPRKPVECDSPELPMAQVRDSTSLSMIASRPPDRPRWRAAQGRLDAELVQLLGEHLRRGNPHFEGLLGQITVGGGKAELTDAKGSHGR